jgi:two-component system response regulator LytT
VVEKKFTNGNIAVNDHFVLIKSYKTLHKINSENILFIEAFGDYVKVHSEDKMIMTNATFTSVLDSLPNPIFIRTHKSFAINFKKMNSISGNQIMIKTHKIPIGQKFKTEFLDFINQNKS